MELPQEAWLEVLLNLPYNEIIKKCRLNKRINNLCNNEEFWKRYIQKNFLINPTKIKMPPQQVAEYASEFLMELFNKKIYPSQRVLPLLFEVLLEEEDVVDVLRSELDAIIENIETESNLNIIDVLSARHMNVFKIDNFILNQDHFTREWINMKEWLKENNQTPDKKILKFILETIEVPTTYLTPKGFKRIKFDVDRMAAIFALNEILERDFGRYPISLRYDIFDAVYGDMMFIKYFENL